VHKLALEIISLKNQKEFELVNNRGVKLTSQFFLLIICKKSITFEPDLKKVVRIGIKVSKKFAKRAVDRNKAKRRIRHLIKKLITSIDTLPDNLSIVFIPRNRFLSAKFDELFTSMRNITKDIL
jgi:ribonuclease P protein component